jgi:hypothetical protein
MAYVNADRVQETSTTTGTGTYSLAGAVSQFRTFVAGVGDGNHCPYLAKDNNDWEIGVGLVTDATPDTLARTTVLKSSNGDAAVNWSSGTRSIMCVPLGDVGSNRLLGSITLSGAADNIGPIIVPVGVTRLWGSAFIVAPGALVPRLRLGGSSIDSGNNYATGNALVNANAVTATSFNAWNLIVAALANTNEAMFNFTIHKPASDRVARGVWTGSAVSIVASTAPLNQQGNGIWVNTADLIQRIQLLGFSALTGTTAANMSAGSNLTVYGSYD